MRLKYHLLILLLLLNLIIGCKSSVDEKVHQKIANDTEEVFDSLVKLRRDFHQYPELSGDEARTASIITRYLIDLGLEVHTEMPGNSVVGILRGGKEGKNIAWRADMDAIPTDFQDNNLPFKSKFEGVQHGCGHDVHMAIALGMAKVLSKNKASLNGTVFFIFQAEEETFLGAKNLVDTGFLSAFNIDEIFALHVTAFPVGQIMVKPNEVFAYQNRIALKFNDGLSTQEIEMLYDELRTETLRQSDSINPWNVTKAFDSLTGLSNPLTGFRDYYFMDENFLLKNNGNHVSLEANTYETERSKTPNLLPTIEESIKKSKYKDSFISASIIQQNPTVLNNDDLTTASIKTIDSIYGKGTVTSSHGQIPYFNDDFIYYQQKIPGVYFLLGASNPDLGVFAMNHAPNFRVDETCIRVGVKTFSSLILERTWTEY